MFSLNIHWQYEKYEGNKVKKEGKEKRELKGGKKEERK